MAINDNEGTHKRTEIIAFCLQNKSKSMTVNKAKCSRLKPNHTGWISDTLLRQSSVIFLKAKGEQIEYNQYIVLTNALWSFW